VPAKVNDDDLSSLMEDEDIIDKAGDNKEVPAT
jgi:hypothetical protein